MKAYEKKFNNHNNNNMKYWSRVKLKVWLYQKMSNVMNN